MIRVDQLREQLRTQATRLRPGALVLRERLQALLAVLVRYLKRLGDALAVQVRRSAEVVVPEIRRPAESATESVVPETGRPAEPATDAGTVVSEAGGPAEAVADPESEPVTGPLPATEAEAVVPEIRRSAEAVNEAVTETAALAAASNGRVRPVTAAAGPQVRRTASPAPGSLAGALGGLIPVVNRAAGVIQHQVEAGRDAHATPRVLRDRKGRRLRASAYAFGPESHERRRIQARSRGVTGALLPTIVKMSLVVLVGFGGFLGSSSAFISYAAALPDAHQITSQPLAEDTLVYAADNSLLADLHPQNQPQHYYESLSSMGRWLPEATVAIEDAGFWTEPGIDVGGIARAAWIDWRSKQAVQGASTITQQLVKLRLTGNQTSFDRKIKEAVLAVQVEHTYTKQQILEQYLNAVDYSNNTKGSLAASRVYFHKDTRDLDLAEASMLAGIPQSPHYNNPFSYWDQARQRQLQVLNAMVRTHVITQEEADEAYAEDISPPNHMFTAGPQVLAAPSFVEWIRDYVLTPMYGQNATFSGGLHVHTTLNMQVQEAAQQAVEDGVNNAHRYNATQGAMVAIDPRSGAVEAMVGSVPNGPGSDYNMSVWPPRNPGSSMKIYNYTAAIASGKYAMSTMVPDTPLTVNMGLGAAPYQPKNYDLKYHGNCQLQQCMGNSLNVPAVKVELTLGVDQVASMARNMGAPPWYRPPDGSRGYSDDDPLSTYGPSLTLGGYGETPLQMATGAAVLGDQGMYHQPFGITSIDASDGTLIFQDNPNQGARRALDPRVAFIMEQIMSNDQNRALVFGTGSPLHLPDRPAAAKTGTTDNFTDAWTVGYTPSLASAFWFGNTDFSPLTTGADGVFVAAPAWHEFMENALNNIIKAPSNEWFAEPPGLGHANVGGEPVWYLPGTNPNQPMPPLPPNASSSASPSPNPSPSPAPGRPPGG